MPEAETLVGVVSDTHGLLRPSALAALEGVERIVHAGDFDRLDILESLEEIAPVSSVRGNVDHGIWAQRLPYTRTVELAGHILYVLHDIGQLNLDPAAAGFAAVIYGHSHQPSIEHRQGVLYLNPGSIGPRRFTLPISMARLRLNSDGVEAEVIELKE
jgi:uncharacterized protein